MEQIMNNPNNKRSIWKTIRSCIPKQTTRQKSYNRDEEIIANEFNSYFTSLGQITSEQINSLAAQSNYDLTQPVVPTQECPDDEQFSFRPMSSGEIEYVIRSMPMNKAPGHYKIPIRMIKDSLPAILSQGFHNVFAYGCPDRGRAFDKSQTKNFSKDYIIYAINIDPSP